MLRTALLHLEIKDFSFEQCVLFLKDRQLSFSWQSVRSGCLRCCVEGTGNPLFLSSRVQRLQVRVTLSYERLAGIKEDFTTLYDHALYGQVLPDVLRLAYLIVHYSRKEYHS